MGMTLRRLRLNRNPAAIPNTRNVARKPVAGAPPVLIVVVVVVVVVTVVELKQPMHGTPINIGVRIIPVAKLPIWTCWFIVAERETLGLNAPVTVGLNVGLTLTPVLKVPGWTVCTIEPLREMDGLLVIAAVCAKDSERLIEGLKLSVVVIAAPDFSKPIETSLYDVEVVTKGVVSEVPRFVMCSEQSVVRDVGDMDWSRV